MFATNINNRGFAEKNERVKVGNCIFPFMYKWKKHTKCFPTAKGNICATSINTRRTLKTYGYCPKKRTKKKAPKTTKTIKIIKPSKKKRKSTIKKLKQKLVVKQIKHNKRKPLKKMDRLNEKLVKLLAELEALMYMKGEPMRALAYSRAQEAIMLIPDDIISTEQLKGVPRIGKTILAKFKEFLETGTLGVLERAKANPIYLFAKIFGIGPKKARQLVEKDKITTLEELRAKQEELLNKNQKKGLKYLADIEKRIPRAEIVKYEKIFRKEFKKLKDGTFEIVGSFRRGAANSGDIDLIISNDGKNKKMFHQFIDALIAKGVVIDVLSKGKIKSMVMAQLPGKPARRVDFMYAPAEEYPFAILYFTGSKAFNVMMRERAKTLGYSMNEHGFTNLKDKSKVQQKFPTEKSIFDFLGMEFKTPEERKDGRAVVSKTDAPTKPTPKAPTPTKSKTLKKKKFSAKKYLKKFETDGLTLLNILSESEIEAMIRTANDFYFNKQALISDSQYDILKEFMEEKFPENPVLQEVGAPIKKNKVKLPFFMPSMNKIKPNSKKIVGWKENYNGPYVITAKLDGVSALYTTMGKKPRMYTRGNGKEGLDISHMIPYLKLPTTKNIVLRGELIMTDKTYKKYLGKYVNGRSAVSGIIAGDVQNATKYKDLNFVAYEVIRPRLKPSAQMAFLKKENVKVVKYIVRKDITPASLSEILIKWRASYKYTIDGLVIIDDKMYPRWKRNPKFAFAFKMVFDDQKAQSVVRDVVWTPSKDGFLKPVIYITPIEIAGTIIGKATAFNAKYIKTNKIGVGAKVEMIRSGDAIPHIVRVISPAAKPKMPSVPYHWNETNVDIILDNIVENTTVREKRMLRFFKSLDVEGLGPGNIKRLNKAGFDNVVKIIKMSKEDFLKAEGFKDKLATKVFTNIHQKLKDATMVEIMAATNIFGRGMGKRRLEAIVAAYPHIMTSENTNLEEKIAELKGFGEKTAQDFVAHLNTFKGFLRDIQLNKKIAVNKGDKKHPLYDKSIVMSGFRDKELAERIEKKTGKPLGNNVSKNTFVVLVKDVDADTGKANDARDLGISLMTPQQFTQKYLD